MTVSKSHVARRVRFFIFDSVTAIPMLIYAFDLTRWELLVVGLAFCFLLWFLERKGLMLPVLMRRIRVVLRGPRTRIRPDLFEQ